MGLLLFRHAEPLDEQVWGGCRERSQVMFVNLSTSEWSSVSNDANGSGVVVGQQSDSQ